MPAATRPLPDFANPPVVEVALSVQFEPLRNLRVPQIGLLWQEFRDRFPVTEEHATIDPAIERFGVAQRRQGAVRVEMLQVHPVPRCWFLNAVGTQLIQVQQDRLIHNWRKVGDAESYPRSEHVRGEFAGELEQFRAFLQRERLGELRPNQCEVTYVNKISTGPGGFQHGDLDKLITLFHRRYSDDFLTTPEEVGFTAHYVIPDAAGEPLGRLHVSVEPVFRESDDQPNFLMNLTARGKPVGESIGGALAFLDLGREWVVRGFASITTQNMHHVWRRQHDR
jgi:uncharacterized protein (TIGR04255 family)